MKFKASILPAVLVLAFSAVAPLGRGQTTPVVTARSFSGLDANYLNSGGARSSAGLIQGSDGNFYGTTTSGGSHGYGTVFKLVPGGALTVLRNFNATDANSTNSDGAEPQAALLQGSDGNFYGTAQVGGVHGGGTIFRITPAGTFTNLHNFTMPTGGALTNTDGAYPSNTLVQDASGNFYGTTVQGGTNGNGTVFKFSAAGTLTTLHTFGSFGDDGQETNADGASPTGILLRDNAGSLFGTTFAGGTNGNGTIYKLTSAGTFSVLHTFGAMDDSGINSNGSHPAGGLTLGSDGDFYGTAYAGGMGGTGTFFQLTPAGTLTTLHNFTASVTGGNNPFAHLTLGSDGNFYGTATQGGTNDSGTIFLITPAGTLTTLYNFSAPSSAGTNNDGADPEGNLLQAADGNFYGTTYDGGTGGTGTILTLVPSLPGRVEFAAASASVSESAGSLTVQVKRTGGSVGAVSVVCETFGGTAKPGTDYTGLSATLNWANGDSAAKTFTVAIKDLGLSDGSTRTFDLKLSSTTGGALLGTPATVPVTIQENDPPKTVQFRAAAASVDENAGSLTVYLSRSGSSTGAAYVICETFGDTAKSGTDYTGLSQTLVWAEGDTTQKAFTVALKDPGVTDGSTRQFSIRLSSPSGAALGSPATEVVTIHENDSVNGDLALASSSESVNETAGSLTVPVQRLDGSAGAVSVTCETSGSTARPGIDYTGLSQTLSWAAGDATPKSFTVAITNRGSAGGQGRQFSIKLSAPTGGATLGSPATATVTIN